LTSPCTNNEHDNYYVVLYLKPVNS